MNIFHKIAASRWTARSTVFAAWFAGSALYLSLHGLLTTQYVAMCSACHAFIIGRAIAEDYKDKVAVATKDGQ